jgi:signal transduction histidine kinase/ligand-binding sensor domain-containing protein
MQVKACFFILYSFVANICFAQLNLRPIRFLTTDNGLSQAINYSILKDSKDFIWLTSYDGLNRFDSRKIITYRSLLQDSTSFKGTLSLGLIEDTNSNIWCGSNSALNVYIRNNNSFKHIKSLGEANDLYIPLLAFKNYIFFKRGNRLFLCDINSFMVKPIELDKAIDILRFTPKVFETKNTLQFFFLSKPLISSSQFTAGYKYIEIQKSNIAKANVKHIQEDALQYYDIVKKDSNNFLLATSQGLMGLDISNNQAKIISTTLSSKKIIALAKIKNGLLLSIKKEGLSVYKEDTKTLTHIQFNSPTDEAELEKYDAEILYVDKNNFLWLSLWGKGIGYVDLSPAYFNHYFTDADLQQNKIKDRYVVSIKCDNDGNAWLTTKTDGIYYINKWGQTIKHIPYPELIRQIPFGDTYIFKGHNNEFYLGSQLGIYKVDINRNKLLKVNIKIEGTPLNGINDIYPSPNNEYLISTQTGLYSCDSKFENVVFKNELSKKEVILRSYIINEKFLLVCRPFVGAILYLKQNNSYIPYDSLVLNTSIKHIYTVPNSDTVYMASTIGVIKYQLQKKSFTLINQPQLLANTYTYSVLPDDNKNLWISHNKGITEYNSSTNSAIHFTKSNGLQGNEFNTNSFDKSIDGTMFFGGTNGLNVFTPANVDSSITTSTLQIIDFKINDITKNNKHTLTPFDTLTLAYKENTFSFIPLVINYHNSDDDECLYKIENIDANWLEGRSNTLVRYSNLPAGKYNMLIKAKNSDSVTQVYIIIQKPFWLTAWFILLAAGFIAILVWLSIRSYYMRKVKKHRAELEKQVAVEHERTRIATDMHDDLGSGLTKITYLSQMALNKQNNTDDLHAIKKTSTELVENMSEIIWAMKEENNSLEDLVYYIKAFALEYCASNNLNCTIQLPEQLYPRIVAGQNRRHIYLVVKEALHNIVKHAQAKNVMLTASFSNQWMLSIKDDGIGFHPSTQEKHIGGNGLKNIYKRIEAVRGSVEIKTNDKGTELIFYIPL